MPFFGGLARGMMGQQQQDPQQGGGMLQRLKQQMQQGGIGPSAGMQGQMMPRAGMPPPQMITSQMMPERPMPPQQGGMLQGVNQLASRMAPQMGPKPQGMAPSQGGISSLIAKFKNRQPQGY